MVQEKVHSGGLTDFSQENVGSEVWGTGWYILVSDPPWHLFETERSDNSALCFTVCIRYTYLVQVFVYQEADQVACLELTTYSSHKVRSQPFSRAPSPC